MATNSSYSLHFASYYIVLLFLGGGEEGEERKERERTQNLGRIQSVNNQFGGFQYNIMRGKKDQTRPVETHRIPRLCWVARVGLPSPLLPEGCHAQHPGKPRALGSRRVSPCATPMTLPPIRVDAWHCLWNALR